MDSASEAEFRSVWARITATLAERAASGGSALFRGPDDTFVGIARWQSRAARDRAFASGVVDSADSVRLRALIRSSEAPLELEALDDRWVMPMPPDS